MYTPNGDVNPDRVSVKNQIEIMTKINADWDIKKLALVCTLWYDYTMLNGYTARGSVVWFPPVCQPYFIPKGGKING